MAANELYSYERKANRVYYDSLKKITSAPLSKTLFILGCQREKAMWLHKNKYKELRLSAETQAKFDRGHIIGSLAQHLFPESTDSSVIPDAERVIDMSRYHLPFTLKQHLWVNNTKNSLSSNKPIYEAAFIQDGVFAAVDILVETESGYVVYEVKSSVEISETYLIDSALQYYVISNRIKLVDFVLVHINEEYIKELDIPLTELKPENCNLEQLLIKTSVLNDFLPLQQDVKAKIARFKDVVVKEVQPTISTGQQCDNPYECGFKQYCSIRPLTVEDIY